MPRGVAPIITCSTAQEMGRLYLEEAWSTLKLARKFHVGPIRAKAILESLGIEIVHKPGPRSGFSPLDSRLRCPLCEIVLEETWIDDTHGNIVHEAKWTEDGICWMCEEANGHRKSKTRKGENR